MRCLACGKVERQRNHKPNTAYTVGCMALLDLLLPAIATFLTDIFIFSKPDVIRLTFSALYFTLFYGGAEFATT